MIEELKGKIEAPAEVKGRVEPTVEIHVEIAGKGPRGKDGKSAYEYAKAGGFLGTEEEFAEKLAREYNAADVTDVLTKDDLDEILI